MSLSLSDSLDRYLTDPAATVAAVSAEQTLSSLTSSLRRDGVTWMLARGAGEANRRRLVAATLAIDVAGAKLQVQPRDVPPLVEWGCEQVRRRLPSDAERQWHVAAMALFEGLGNVQAAEAHLAHAVLRFPDDTEWRHARVWLRDSRTLNVHPRQPLHAAKIAFPSALAAEYQGLTAVPEFAADAWVRIGFLHFLARANADASAAFANADTAPGAEAGTRYLTRLFTAWMAERDGKHDDAIRELRAALTATPDGRTAAAWLAVRYQIAGRGADAQPVAARSLSSRGVDPWRTFYGGDIRRWPELIVASRKAAQ